MILFRSLSTYPCDRTGRDVGTSSSTSSIDIIFQEFLAADSAASRIFSPTSRNLRKPLSRVSYIFGFVFGLKDLQSEPFQCRPSCMGV